MKAINSKRSSGEGDQMSCCSRLFAEWRIPFFSLTEVNGKIIDVEASFAPKPFFRTLLAKTLFLGVSIEILIQDLSTYEYREFYFIYLTHWGFVTSIFYFFLSFLISLFDIAKQPPKDERPGFIVRLTWGLFAAAATTELVITILFWSLDYDPANGLTYVSCMKHGGIMVLVLIEGLIINRIPVRMKHYIFVATFVILYITWSLVHALLGIGNPNQNDNDPQTDDDAIYPVLSWNNNLKVTLIVASGTLFVIAPLLFLLVWSLSLWSCCCRFQGANRHYISASKNVKNGSTGSSYFRMDI